MTGADRRSADRAAATAAATAAVLIAQLVAAKTTRDALFLSSFSATQLPLAMGASAVLALGVVLALSRTMARRGPDRVVPTMLALNALLFAGEWALAGAAPRAVAAAVYVHTAAFGAAAVSSFWSLVNERFDPHTARQVMGRIAAGAGAGGVIGGIAAWQLTAVASLRAMLAVIAVANLVGAAMAFATRGPATSARRVDASAAMAGALSILRGSGYLRRLAALVVLVALGETAIDYVFKATAQLAHGDSAALARFFALFHMSANVGSFALQAGFTRRALQRLGIAPTIAFMPGVHAIAGAAALAVPGLATVTAMRGTGAALESSLFRSGYELLYTPLPPAQKRPTKALIDVGGDKLGGAAGSALALLVVALFPLGSHPILVAVAIAAAAGAIALTVALHRGYVRALADGLRAGAIDLDDEALLDATTRRTLADTVALDRGRLLAEIEARQQAGRGAADGDALARAIDTGDRRAIETALRQASPLPAALVPRAIALLGRDDVLPAAVGALREIAADAAPALVAALRDSRTPDVVRRRLPRVLRTAPSQTVAEGLVDGLRDPRFEVRYRCAVALVRVQAKAPDIALDPAAILAAARAEIRRELSRTGTALIDRDDEAHPLADEEVVRKLSDTISHVFTLLSLVLDREPLQLAFCALASDDDRLRGTGLEYLDNVLPDDLLAVLRPALGDRRVTRVGPRPREHIVEDLLASRDSLIMDRAALLGTDDD